jgi:hypothetical protein
LIKWQSFSVSVYGCIWRNLPAPDDDSYDLVCLKKDEAIGLITLYVKLDLVHHIMNNKTAKQILDTSHNLFDAVNTTQVNQLDTELSNLKIDDFTSIEEYIASSKNLKADIITSNYKEKSDSKCQYCFE